MVLAADVRNGRVSVGVSGGDGGLVRFRLSAAERSADEWDYLISSMLADRGVLRGSFTQGILSSVVPAMTPVFAQVLSRFLPQGEAPLVVGPGIKTGLRIRTDTPSEVGGDLVANAVAAARAAGGPCVIVDFGVVLSFTALDAAGDLVGVALAPGLESAAADLRLRAAQLPQVRLEYPARAAGKNTGESVRAGIMIGWSGLTDRLIEAVSAEIALGGSRPALIGTGEGALPPVKTAVPFDLWNPDLALEGLFIIAGRNAPA